VPRYGPYYHPFAILPSANAIAHLSMPSALHCYPRALRVRPFGLSPLLCYFRELPFTTRDASDCPSDAMISLIPCLAPLATPSLAMPHDGRLMPTLCVYMYAPIFPTELAERPAGNTRYANHTTPQIRPVKANPAIHLSRFPFIFFRQPMGEMVEQLGSRRQLPSHCERSLFHATPASMAFGAGTRTNYLIGGQCIVGTKSGAKWPFPAPLGMTYGGRTTASSFLSLGVPRLARRVIDSLVVWVSRPRLGNEKPSSPIEKHFVLQPSLCAVCQLSCFLATAYYFPCAGLLPSRRHTEPKTERKAVTRKDTHSLCSSALFAMSTAHRPT
ncbi:hypothetical protein EDB84DRAFT_1470909, partial [Lactarius hengduanensis]